MVKKATNKKAESKKAESSKAHKRSGKTVRDSGRAGGVRAASRAAE
jgi:hypothetical protein